MSDQLEKDFKRFCGQNIDQMLAEDDDQKKAHLMRSISTQMFQMSRKLYVFLINDFVLAILPIKKQEIFCPCIVFDATDRPSSVFPAHKQQINRQK